MRKLGIDISKYQGKFIPQGNIDFVVIKATEGLAVDPEFKNNLNAVMTVPERGIYHYFRTSLDPEMQAEFFHEKSAGFDFLAVDYEAKHNKLDSAGEKGLRTFYQRLSKLTEKPVLLYCTEYTLRDCLLAYNSFWIDVPFWVARRGTGLDPMVDDPLFLHLGNDWAIWQYSNEGRGGDYGVQSVHVDLDVLRELDTDGGNEMKKPWTSKTILFFILSLLVAVAGLFGFADFTVTAEQAQIITVVVSLVGIALRFLTKEPIQP